MKVRLPIAPYFVCLWFLSIVNFTYSQNISFDNTPPLSGGGTSKSVAFNLTTNQPIIIDSLQSAFYSGTGSVNIWYNPDKIDGSAPNVSITNGWTNLGSILGFSGITSNVNSPVLQTIPVGLSLHMNPQDTFAFYIEWGGRGTGIIGPVTTPNANIPSFTDNTVTIITDSSCAYGGLPTNLSSPNQFNGGLIYHLNLNNCPPFTDFEIDSLLDSSFKVNWVPGDSSDSFYFEYGPAGFTPGSSAGTLISGNYSGSNQPPLYISGLTANTKYDYYFGEICSSSGDTISIQPDSLTTAFNCPSVSDPVDFTYRSGDSVAFSFQSFGNQFDFEYGLEGFSPGSGTTVSGGNPFGIGGLQALTTYDIYIRNNCSSESGGTSAWFGPVSFTTRCAITMSGAYTIDVSQPTTANNFSSFSDLADELNTCGISGPVIINVAQGSYNDQVLLEDIEGSSSANTITIQADPSNTGIVELSYSANSVPENYIFHFDSVSYITVKGLTLTASSSSYGRIFELTGEGSHISIEDNILNGVNTTSQSDNLAIIMNPAANVRNGIYNRIHYLTVRNNEINGGSIAMDMTGVSAADRENGLIIDSNIVRGFYSRGLNISHQSNMRMRGNLFSTTSDFSSIYGTYISWTEDLRYTGNRVFINGSGNTRAASFSSSDGTATEFNLVANNMFSATNESGTIYGVSIQASDFFDFIHNSILTKSTGSFNNGAALSLDNPTSGANQDIRLLNNNIASTGTGAVIAIELETNGNNNASVLDYNNYYSDGDNLGIWDDITKENLSFWKASGNTDSNSISTDPHYLADDSLYTTANLLNNHALSIPEVTTDIDGKQRSASPDIGAHEFPYIEGACASFENFNVDSITDSGFTLNWTPGSGNTSFYIEYGPDGFTPGSSSGTLISGTYPGSEPPVYISGLNPDSEYDIYFGEICNSGQDSSYLKNGWTVKTLESCPPVNGPVNIEYVSSDSVSLSFVSSADSNAFFEYEYGPAGYEQGTGTRGIITNPGGIGDLSPLTYYDIYLRSNCSSTGGLQSLWYGPYTFLTACVNALSGTYTIDESLGTEGRNFRNFGDMAFRLEVCGVSGPVVVNIKEDVYNEQIRLGKIPGASKANNVILQADPSNTGAVEIEYTATQAGNNYVWKFDSTSFVTLRGVTLTSNSFNYGRVLEFSGEGSHIIVEDNILNGNPNTSENSTDMAVIMNDNNQDDRINYFTIKNNHINGGSHGIYWHGNSINNMETGNTIDSNHIEGYHYTGIRIHAQDSLTERGNIISSMENGYGTVLGLSHSNMQNFSCLGNKISISAGILNRGITLQNVQGTANNSSVIANNMITTLNNTGATNAISVTNCNFTAIVHNSIMVTSGSPSQSHGIFINAMGRNPSPNPGVEILNNNIVNISGGAAVVVSEMAVTRNAVEIMDYNNYYVNGSLTGNWDGNTASGMADWVTLTGMDSNSVSGDPLYTSETDLHAASPLLKGAGKSQTYVSDDFDAETRSTAHPDIGADEFVLAPCYPPYNLSVAEVYLDSIILKWFPGANNSYVIEYGNAGFTRGSGTQVSTISDTIYTLDNLLPQNTYDIYVSSYCGASDTSIWYGPLTVRTECEGRLSGTYTIDQSLPGGGSNFRSFTDAASALNNCGIEGPVVFNIAQGVYNESFTLQEIEGTDLTNTVVFQADTGNSQAVVLQDTASNAEDNYVVHFDNTSFVSIRGITISAHSPTYGQVIEFSGDSRNIVIEENILNGAVTNSTSTNLAVIRNNSGNQNKLDHSIIRNNEINGGSYGIYWYGEGTSEHETENTIEGNTINGFVQMGISSFYQDSLVIHNNSITSGNNYSHVYGTRIYNSQHAHFTNNKVVIRGSVENHGLALSNVSGSASDPTLIANNMISALDNSATTYGIRIQSTDSVDLVFNSILLNKGSSGSSALDIDQSSGSGNIKIQNNNIVNTGGGTAINITSAVSIAEMDHNNYFVSGSTLGNWSSTPASDLNAWRNQSSMDNLSISTDPLFTAPDDLHYQSIYLDDKAIPYTGISFDIDGEMRSASSPDIGADEFASLDTDLFMVGIIEPLDSSCGDSSGIVEVAIYNRGTQDASGFNIETGVNGQNISSTYSGTLESGEKDTVQVTGFNTSGGGVSDIESYIDFQDDMDLNNDTAATQVYLRSSNPPIPSAARDFFCGDQAYDTLYFPNRSYDYEWFTSDGVLIGNEDSLVVGPLNERDTAFVLEYAENLCNVPGGIIELSYISSPEARFNVQLNSPTETDLTIIFDASASSGAQVYSWNFGNGSIANGDSVNHTYTSNGSYDVELIVSGDCGSDTIVQTVNIEGIGIAENIIKESLKVYPNPTRDLLNIRFQTGGSENINITLTDLSGKSVFQKSVANSNGTYEGQIDLQPLSKGTYLLQIESLGIQAFRKVVKR